MKKVISLLGMILLCCGISYATKVSITDNWKFTPSDSENFASSGLDDSKWRTVSIPHTWNDKDIIDEQRGYRRAASWYRKHLNIPLDDYLLLIGCKWEVWKLSCDACLRFHCRTN